MAVRARRTVAILGACAAGIGGVGIANAVSQADESGAVVPNFTQLPVPGTVPPAARDALARAGAPKAAPVSVTDRGETLVLVVQDEHTFMAIYDKASERSTVVDTPANSLARNAGTWVASGGSRSSKLALLVPDGIANVNVTKDGATTEAPVTGNIALIEQEGEFAAQYKYDGVPRVAKVQGPPGIPEGQ